jgi:hypothetical protein
MNNFLKTLKVGDYVIINQNLAINSVAKIVRETKTLFIVGKRGLRFKKTSGRLQSSSPWDICYLEEATPEKIKAIKQALYRKKLTTKIQYFSDWTNMNIIQLENVYKIIDSYEKDKNSPSNSDATKNN